MSAPELADKIGDAIVTTAKRCVLCAVGIGIILVGALIAWVV